MVHGCQLQITTFLLINIGESSLEIGCITIFLADHCMSVYPCGNQYIAQYADVEVIQIPFCNVYGFCYFSHLRFGDKYTFRIDKNIIAGGILLHYLVWVLLEFFIEITHHFFSTGIVYFSYIWCTTLTAD